MVDFYQQAVDQIKNFVEHRQATNSTYLAVNTAIIAGIAFLIKDGQILGIAQASAILILLVCGMLACDLWRRLINQYKLLIAWWYEQLRLIESNENLSTKLFTKEYDHLYANKMQKIGLTSYQIRLAWIFFSLYFLFSVVIILYILYTLFHR